jgi:hypothetical protein
MKPRIKTRSVALSDKVVAIHVGTSDCETRVDAARRRAGGSFGYERKDFEWKSGPTVLTQWLTNRLSKK